MAYYDKPLSAIALFPLESTSDKPFDPSKPPKRWRDPNPQGAGKNVVYTVVAQDDFGRDVGDAAGFAVTEPMVLSKVEAAELNIPPQEWEVTVGKPAEIPVPIDLKALGANERIVIQSISNMAVVRDMVAYKAENDKVSVDDEAKEILAIVKRIAAKVGA